MRDDERKMVRDAFGRAAGDEPSIDRLLDAVPRLQAEARARRSEAPDVEARRLVPKLALATAAMTILALFLVYSGGIPARSKTTLDSLILSGATGGESDTLLEAVLSTERTP